LCNANARTRCAGNAPALDGRHAGFHYTPETARAIDDDKRADSTLNQAAYALDRAKIINRKGKQ
jgi:hypothetical protein